MVSMEFSRVAIFFVNVFGIALFGAIFEIVMERDKGWGGGLDKGHWYGRIIGENNPAMKFLSVSAGVPYFFGYAVAMYFVLVPTVLLFQSFYFDLNFFLILAVYFSILALEDFLWFAFNPFFPSLSELLKGPRGSIWWHKKWVRIGNDTYLPQSYFTSALLVALFLALALLG